MSNSITRSPSASLIHDSLADYGQRPEQAAQACEDRLERYLGNDPETVLDRGRRLFDLVRDIPKSTDAGSAQVPDLPGDLPNMQAYLSAAHGVVKHIVRAVDAKASAFQLARAALRPEDFQQLASGLTVGTLEPMVEELMGNGVDVPHLAQDFGRALALSFFAEDAIFRYAMNLSPETLQFLASDQAASFRNAMTQMLTAIQAKALEVEEMAAGSEPPVVEPLSSEDQAKVDRMEAALADIDPDLLAKLDAPEQPEDAASWDKQTFRKREILLAVANALSETDLAEMAAFHRSAARAEIAAKADQVAVDRDNGLLHVLANDLFTTYMEDAQLTQLIAEQGVELPEDPEKRAAFLAEVRQLLKREAEAAQQDGAAAASQDAQ